MSEELTTNEEEELKILTVLQSDDSRNFSMREYARLQELTEKKYKLSQE